MTQLPDEKAGKYATPVDIAECDREPIHVPGSIQPHGIQLVLDDTDLRIVQASSNTRELVGFEPSDLLGQSVEMLLGAEQMTALRKVISDRDARPTTAVRLQVKHEYRTFNGIPHRHRGILFLELEPTGSVEEAALASFQKIQAVLSLMHRARSIGELLRTIVTEVRGVIGYDRVMVYKFDRAGNGEVIAEEVSKDHEQFLGLHYPASDIPQQARILYTINCIRHIPDVNYQPSELIPLIYPLTRELTDMSHATLRSVSPVHVEYLQNMGVQASMSISIMVGGKLWGLIACHHYTPKFVPFEMRVACDLVGEVVSLVMAALESEEHTRYRTRTNVRQAELLEAMGAESDTGAALLGRTAALLDYIPCEGCAVGVGDEVHLQGRTPTREQVLALMRRMRRTVSPIFATDDLRSAFAEAEAFKSRASGMISATISKERAIYVMWFRPEQRHSVKWSGDPSKRVYMDEKKHLHPRNSFDLWTEVVEGKCVQWTAHEIQAATDLRGTLAAMMMQRGTSA